MTLIRIVSAVIARRKSPGSIVPVASTGSSVTSAPSRSRKRSGSMIAGCSTCVEMTCLRARLLAKNMPFSARLFDSLPPLVNTTSDGSQPSSSATSPRARSTIAREGMPAQCGLEGLP
jgi:hypothetical protein